MVGVSHVIFRCFTALFFKNFFYSSIKIGGYTYENAGVYICGLCYSAKSAVEGYLQVVDFLRFLLTIRNMDGI